MPTQKEWDAMLDTLQAYLDWSEKNTPDAWNFINCLREVMENLSPDVKEAHQA